MIISEKVKKTILYEYFEFRNNLYAGKSLEERQELDQFFTPPEIIIPMIEKFDCDSLSGLTILDPTSGSGNLLVACLIAGADPDKVFGNEYDPAMVKLCRDRIKKVCKERNLEGFKDYQIHQGNALHKFCLNYFAEDYDKIYFESVKTARGREGRLNNCKNDECAMKRLKKSDLDVYIKNFATKMCNINDTVDESKVNIAKICDDNTLAESEALGLSELW